MNMELQMGWIKEKVKGLMSLESMDNMKELWMVYMNETLKDSMRVDSMEKIKELWMG